MNEKQKKQILLLLVCAGLATLRQDGIIDKNAEISDEISAFVLKAMSNFPGEMDNVVMHTGIRAVMAELAT